MQGGRLDTRDTGVILAPQFELLAGHKFPRYSSCGIGEAAYAPEPLSRFCSQNAKEDRPESCRSDHRTCGATRLLRSYMHDTSVSYKVGRLSSTPWVVLLLGYSESQNGTPARCPVVHFRNQF